MSMTAAILKLIKTLNGEENSHQRALTVYVTV